MKVLDSSLDQEPFAAGFGTVDEKGRISLPKPVRGALGIEPGSAVVYIVLDGVLMVVPQDEHLAALMDRAAQALAAAGMTARDLLDELPAARAEVVTDAYGAEFLREMERLKAQAQDE